MTDYIAPIKYVIDHAQHVQINEVAIDNYVNSFTLPHIDHCFASCPFEYHSLPNPKDEITRRFIQDAQAFCFWGYPAKWSFAYKGDSLDGWWGFLAAIQNAIELGQNISPMQLDGILWVASQVKNQKDKPYHLTSTTNY